jgi:2-polyprenyl-6-methoxyphenol hydroxylase-like FAD-dependent oxidoreductase
VRVGVVGCGTAGAAAAILLARAGCEVTVLERVPEPKAVGAGIILQPTGQAVLARLGLVDQVAAKGARLDRLYLRTVGGRTLADLHYAAIDPAWYGLGIHRGALFEALYGAARDVARVHTGVEVKELRRDGAVTYANEYGPFDLIVLADGAASALRAADAATYPWGALWFVGTSDRFTGELYQVAERAHRLYRILPTGQGLVSLFWSLPAARLDEWRAQFAAWKAEVARFDPRIEPVLAQITSPDQVTFARYRDVRMRDRDHDDRREAAADRERAVLPLLGGQDRPRFRLVDRTGQLQGVCDGGGRAIRPPMFRATGHHLLDADAWRLVRAARLEPRDVRSEVGQPGDHAGHNRHERR